MKTISLSIDTNILNKIRQQQSVIIRRSFKLAEQGHSFKSINDLLVPFQNGLDGHIFRCGIEKGIYLAKAHKEIDKLNETETNVIFGSKRHFIRRCKGLITNEQWKELREQPLYSIGQANVKGNRKFRIDYIKRKIIYDNKYTFDIPVLKNNLEIILEELSRKTNNKDLALTYTVSRDTINITFDEQQLECYQKKYVKYDNKPNHRYMGIDLNPNRIGIAIYEPSKGVIGGGDVIFAQQFELTSKKQNIRRNEVSHICDAIYKIMKCYGVSRLGMEDLTIKTKDHGKGRKFNGVVNQWIRQFILNKMKMICDLIGVKFCLIFPGYSSFIGTIRNPGLGDCCGAAAEIARRCAYRKGDFYPSLISTTTIEHQWKEMAGVGYNTWVELYQEFKNRKLGWRSPPDISRSCKMGAHSMRVLVLPSVSN